MEATIVVRASSFIAGALEADRGISPPPLQEQSAVLGPGEVRPRTEELRKKEVNSADEYLRCLMRSVTHLLSRLRR